MFNVTYHQIITHRGSVAFQEKSHLNVLGRTVTRDLRALTNCHATGILTQGRRSLFAATARGGS